MGLTNGDFWLDRLSDTVERAMAARTERTRAAYLELARHYRSMYQLTERPAARQRPAASAHQADNSRRLDFGSVHDVLMRAA
jgi:hypothetical protein